MAKDKNAQLRNLIAGYGDSIRLSDIKALIAVLFVAIMMGTVLQFRQLYPHYLSVPVILTPFMIIFVNLLISVYPRFPRAGRRRFPIWRNPDPEDFDFVADTEAELEGLPALSSAIGALESELAGRGRVLVRYSGTEPKLRLLVEGPTDADVRSGIERLSAAARADLEVL